MVFDALTTFCLFFLILFWFFQEKVMLTTLLGSMPLVLGWGEHQMRRIYVGQSDAILLQDSSHIFSLHFYVWVGLCQSPFLFSIFSVVAAYRMNLSFLFLSLIFFMVYDMHARVV
jgi:hypothetical protein